MNWSSVNSACLRGSTSNRNPTDIVHAALPVSCSPVMGVRISKTKHIKSEEGLENERKREGGKESKRRKQKQTNKQTKQTSKKKEKKRKGKEKEKRSSEKDKGHYWCAPVFV